MKFLVEILSGSSFMIEVDKTDTLLEVKQRIEKSQCIPVSKQTLIVDGIFILRVDLNVEQCQIVHDSHLQLDVSSDDNPNHKEDQMPQTDPSLETTQDISKIQDSSLKVWNNLKKIVVIILVMPYSGESKAAKNIHFIANTTDQVKILRHELIQSQLRGHLNRPQDGCYFSIHKGRVLNEDQSFEWNSVGHTDTVEIVPDPWLY